MKILVTGSSGLIGSALVSALTGQQHEVIRLTRSSAQAAGTIILWDPDASHILDHERLEGLDAVVHLAGKNIAESRWTPTHKAAIRNSRVHGTALIARTLSELRRPPRTFISASAVGYYGNRGDEVLTEESSHGSGFLADLCEDWETAAREAGPNLRLVILRIGFVLSGQGGGLPKMLNTFRLGLGGTIGGGRQHMSWITVDEVTRVIQFILAHEQISGPVNAVSPNPATNYEFTKALGRVLRRPARLPVPTFVVRSLLGEMADELLLTSQRIIPEKLKRAGYPFRHPDIEEALRYVLGNGRPRAEESESRTRSG